MGQALPSKRQKNKQPQNDRGYDGLGKHISDVISLGAFWRTWLGIMRKEKEA